MSSSESTIRRHRRALARAALALPAALALGLGASPAAGVTVNLDRDRAPERLVQVSVRLPYFSRPVQGRTWAVVDTVAGRRRVVRLGPPGEVLQRPRIADRNGDGLRDVFLQAVAGNSLFLGELWQWDGRRATRLWRSTSRPLERRLGAGQVLNFPTATRFPDPDGDGVRDIVQAGTVGVCRACPPDRVVTVRWRWSPRAGRYVLAGVRGV